MLEKVLTISFKNKMQQFHWHDKLELFFVLRGSMGIIVNGREEELYAGCISLVNRDDVHCVENVSDDVLYFQMSLDMIKFEQYLPEISKVYFKSPDSKSDVFSEGLKEEIKNYIAQIVRMMETENAVLKDEQMIIYYCIQILSNLKYGFNYVDSKINEGHEHDKFDQLWETVDYVYDNCNRKLTLKEVAEHIYVTPSYLRVLMKNYTGHTFEEFLAFARVESSLKNLINSDLSITNIAYECGFSAPRYYYTAFEKAYHCTPAEYRKKNSDFFKMEETSAAIDIMYDNGIGKEECLELLSQFNLYDQDKNLRRINHEIDVSKPLAQKGSLAKSPEILRCTDIDILNFNFAGKINECRLNLGSSGIYADTQNKSIIASLKKQIGSLGMELVDNKTEKYTNLCELFDEYGVKLPEYYVREALYKVADPYMVLSKNCIVYGKKDSLEILVFNSTKFENPKYEIEIIGMDPDCDYICCIKELKKLSDKMNDLLQDAKGRAQLTEADIRGITEPSIRYELYSSDTPCIITGRLANTDVVRIQLKKIEKQLI